MVQNIINLEEHEDRVISIVKAKHGLRSKSEAIALITKAYEENFLEPELRPEYLKKLERLKKEKGIPFKNIKELRKIIEG
ncbi:MAG TPA: DUF2683 family protein [Nanoarchaeota archaeon]|nr:DUF2683 family protein [Candidatus Pacearchaeota archaeon]HIH18031.1 DUF2683 family protein [Nanoarchaeota archaeon]HIH34632.1 DUF2683 family protein [Nanoarchaeota archaeon]HIH51373.1 DUF2683 family protein [Nanoarchaeota archaeon]HIH66228.1 DUF2683 family protein [Nanoarchaeota archaeon]